VNKGNTNIGVLSFAGADCTTFLAPASICAWQDSSVKKKPVQLYLRTLFLPQQVLLRQSVLYCHSLTAN
jgi:hypothetical protein